MTRITTSAYSADEAYSHVRRISWGAVFAGTILAIVVQITLTLLGLGIGIGTIDPMAASPAEGLGIGSVIWGILSLLISIFVGGWVAGRLAGIPRSFESILHGLLTWGVFTLFSLFLLTTAIGNIIGGATSFIGQTMDIGGQEAMAMFSEAEDQAQQEQEQRSEEEVERQREEVQAYGQEAAGIASKVGIFTAIALVLGAGAAAAGGKLGETHDLESRGPGRPAKS